MVNDGETYRIRRAEVAPFRSEHTDVDRHGQTVSFHCGECLCRERILLEVSKLADANDPEVARAQRLRMNDEDDVPCRAHRPIQRNRTRLRVGGDNRPDGSEPRRYLPGSSVDPTDSRDVTD